MAALVKKIISTAKAPAAMGPYSQAVLVDRTMYIAGQLGLDPSNGQFVPGGTKEQAKQALHNIGEILKAAGCDYDNVFKCNFPARAAYQVAALPKGARVEIEAIAITGPLQDAPPRL
uniref:2-iminobutanoate/2-iminopropanoate deaminase isoform X3 n=1 Tax=Podarcis muralis TaxID=64176 RepID=UPI0010A07B79|nr:2-iminobutanoate/2-iminopropanoate deaminase isoform X3 [Podarcis muralis]